MKRETGKLNTDLMEEELDVRLPKHTRTMVLVEPDPLPDKAGSLFIPEEHREQREHRRWWGTVVETNEGHWDLSGKARWVPADVEPGTRVWYDRNSGAEGDPFGAYGLALIPEDAIHLKIVPDEEVREDDGDVEELV